MRVLGRPEAAYGSSGVNPARGHELTSGYERTQGGSDTTVLRPADLARYIAWSARASRLAPSSPSPSWATPKLAVSAPPSGSIGRRRCGSSGARPI